MNRFTKDRLLKLDHFSVLFPLPILRPIKNVVSLLDVYQLDYTPKDDFRRDTLGQLEFIQEQLEHDIDAGFAILRAELTRLIAGECKK